MAPLEISHPAIKEIKDNVALTQEKRKGF